MILTSGFRGFGGLSGIRLDAKGERFISFSDKGSWFTGRIVYSGREMTSLADVEAAPMIGPDGRPITARGWFDSELIALDGSFVYIGLERVNQVLRFDFSKGFTRSRGEVVPMPPAAKKLPFNKGLEALVFVPKGLPLAGTLIAMSERGLDAQGNLIAFLVGGPTPGQFSVRRTDNFDISDAVLLPSGDLLILERKFSWLGGLGIRIRRIPLKIAGTRRRGRGPQHLQRRSRPGDRQYGGHRRPCDGRGRHRADHGLRRQFLDAPAHAAAAVHTGGVKSLRVTDDDVGIDTARDAPLIFRGCQSCNLTKIAAEVTLVRETKFGRDQFDGGALGEKLARPGDAGAQLICVRWQAIGKSELSHEMELADPHHLNKRFQRDVVAQIPIDEIAHPAQLSVCCSSTPPAFAAGMVPDEVNRGTP